MKHLQKIGCDTDKGGKGTTGKGGLVGHGSTLEWWWDRWTRHVGRVGWLWDIGGGGGDVGVNWQLRCGWVLAVGLNVRKSCLRVYFSLGGLNSPSTGADGLSNRGVGLGERAWAVGDGQSGRLNEFRVSIPNPLHFFPYKF